MSTWSGIPRTDRWVRNIKLKMKSVEDHNPSFRWVRSIEEQVNMNNEIKEEVRIIDAALETDVIFACFEVLQGTEELVLQVIQELVTVLETDKDFASPWRCPKEEYNGRSCKD